MPAASRSFQFGSGTGKLCGIGRPARQTLENARTYVVLERRCGRNARAPRDRPLTVGPLYWVRLLRQFRRPGPACAPWLKMPDFINEVICEIREIRGVFAFRPNSHQRRMQSFPLKLLGYGRIMPIEQSCFFGKHHRSWVIFGRYDKTIFFGNGRPVCRPFGNGRTPGSKSF
jgi:hypothetical protein